MLHGALQLSFFHTHTAISRVINRYNEIAYVHIRLLCGGCGGIQEAAALIRVKVLQENVPHAHVHLSLSLSLSHTHTQMLMHTHTHTHTCYAHTY